MEKQRISKEISLLQALSRLYSFQKKNGRGLHFIMILENGVLRFGKFYSAGRRKMVYYYKLPYQDPVISTEEGFVGNIADAGKVAFKANYPSYKIYRYYLGSKKGKISNERITEKNNRNYKNF